ncbi:MAG: HNH endonuclease [Methylococcales symbiont of Hymedesmia sp. n. MRB-2018]|nr:MAG: HNH endonuclease [Methylococcales symbiont of Hymedesmia sp. n. MRB-2018]
MLDFEKDTKGIQIEHIMPRVLNEHWREITDEEHVKFIHTLGNLSLTYNNQGLSNKSFSDKKRHLKDKSKINLNQLLNDYDTFGPIQINDRLNKLINMFNNEYLTYKNKLYS